jgi:hypothetical protein
MLRQRVNCGVDSTRKDRSDEAGDEAQWKVVPTSKNGNDGPALEHGEGPSMVVHGVS